MIPFLGGLYRMKPKHYWLAIKEVAGITLLATMPIWGAALFSSISAASKISAWNQAVDLYLDCLRLQIEGGILIIYSASLVSPVLILALEQKKDSPELKLPDPVAHIIGVLVVQFVATIFFSITLSNGNINNGFSFYLSILIFSFSMFIVFVVCCHKHFDKDADPNTAMNEQSALFADKYNRHRGARS